MNDYELKNATFAKKNTHLLRNALLVFISVLVLALAIFLILFFIFRYNTTHITNHRLKEYWNSSLENKYELIYTDGKQLLLKDPFNNTTLIYYGYACFYMAVSQTDSSEMQYYLDECISSLRLSLYSAKDKTIPQIYYMLGKAYFYKNQISQNYYSDLTIYYFTEAVNRGYKADDIPEYLGMTYAAVNKPMESISAFSEALLVRESDSLLISIAEQYKKVGQNSSCKQYLFRVINNCENEDLIARSRIMLGNIYLEEDNIDEALIEFESVLKNNPNSTDALYGIGVIYDKQGNLIKARKVWRDVLKLQPNHAGALNKLAERR